MLWMCKACVSMQPKYCVFDARALLAIVHVQVDSNLASHAVMDVSVTSVFAGFVVALNESYP